jgi:hypothetical protein
LAVREKLWGESHAPASRATMRRRRMKVDKIHVCQTQSELLDECLSDMQKVRSSAMEEAAKICDEVEADERRSASFGYDSYSFDVAKTCAAAIRAKAKEGA